MEITDSERWWWGILLLSLALPVALLARGSARPWLRAPANAPALEDFGVVPDFALTERSGRTLTRADLAGAPWVADFVYTQCQGTCPLLSAKMATLERRVAPDVRLVSFSVDPARDTPDALAAYAQRFGASPTAWLFATGEPRVLRDLVGKGFHLAVVDPPPGETDFAGTITHSEKIVLVDADLRIRRYYDGASDTWVDEAIADLAYLGRRARTRS
jgi:protein SCO1/2